MFNDRGRLDASDPVRHEEFEGSYLYYQNKRSIRVSEMERDHEVRIIAFERADGSASSIPTVDSLLYAGDSILACVRHDVITQFSRYILD